MIFGIPLQVFSGLATFVMSFLANRAKHKMEIEEAKNRRMIELLAAQNEQTKAFMECQNALVKDDPYYAWTRRTLALGIVFGTMTALFLVPVLFPEVPWIIEVKTLKSTFLGLFGTREVNELVQLHGIPFFFGEVFSHICIMVAGFYFGHTAGRVRNPYR